MTHFTEDEITFSSMQKPPTTTTSRKRKRTEQIEDMVRLRFGHNMGYQQIADKYGINYDRCWAAIHKFRKNEQTILPPQTIRAAHPQKDNT